jgi:uncharacterized protein
MNTMNDDDRAIERANERTMEEVATDECLELLRSHCVGRIALVADDEEAPHVVPVNYVMDGQAIVFRTGPGTKARRLHSRPVSFEVDVIDLVHRAGWSVLVHGMAHEATTWEIAHLDIEPWGPGPKHRWVRIEPTAITGRRIRLAEYVADGRGYL